MIFAVREKFQQSLDCGISAKLINLSLVALAHIHAIFIQTERAALNVFIGQVL